MGRSKLKEQGNSGNFNYVPEKRVRSVISLMYAMFRRRSWFAARRCVRVLGKFVLKAPIDFVKGACEIARRRPDQHLRTVRFYRKLISVQLFARPPVQSQLYTEYIALEFAFLLVTQGLQSQAMVHLREMVAKESFASSAMVHGYAGVIAFECAREFAASRPEKDPSHSEINLAQESVRCLARAVYLMPTCSAFVSYLVRASNQYPECGESASDVLDRFVAKDPHNPNAVRMMLEHLVIQDPVDHERVLQTAVALLALDPVSSAFTVVVEQFARGGVPPEHMFQVACERLSYLPYDQAAWTLTADLLREHGDSIPPPPAWWMQMHFRHPRAQAAAIGLPFQQSACIREAQPEQKHLAAKCAFLLYLTPLTDECPRYVSDTLTALQTSADHDTAADILVLLELRVSPSSPTPSTPEHRPTSHPPSPSRGSPPRRRTRQQCGPSDPTQH